MTKLRRIFWLLALALLLVRLTTALHRRWGDRREHPPPLRKAQRPGALGLWLRMGASALAATAAAAGLWLATEFAGAGQTTAAAAAAIAATVVVTLGAVWAARAK